MTDDVQIANRRLDASGNDALIGMARMGADAFGYKAELRINRGLAQLLRLRVCAAQQLHLLPQPALRGGARGGHPPGQDRHADRVVGDRACTPRPSRRRSGYAEALTRVADTDRDAAFQRFHDALAAHFDPEEMLEIVRRRDQHERLDPPQARRGRDAGPGGLSHRADERGGEPDGRPGGDPLDLLALPPRRRGC